MLSIQEKEIKKVLSSITGRRLLACMLLVQPISVQELERFPDFFCEVFDSSRSPIKNRDFPKVANINKKEGAPLFRSPFDPKELKGKDRILQRAVRSGLIHRVPMKKGWKKNCYYFLNSDLIFNISADGLEITENKKVYPKTFTHYLFSSQDNKRISLPEKIAFRQLDYIANPNDETYRIISIPLRNLFVLFWWMIKHPSFFSDLLDVHVSNLYDPKKKGADIKLKDFSPELRKQRSLFIKAERDSLITIVDGDRLILNSTLFSLFFDHKISLSFVPSYSTLSCFSNFKNHVGEIFPQKRKIQDENHKRKTMMELLQILTSEDYTIIPEKRKTVFTSILMYKNLDMKQINKYTPVPVETDSTLLKRLKLPEITSIARNTNFVEQIFVWPEGPVAPFFIESFPNHFLLTDIWRTYSLNESKGARYFRDSFLIRQPR